MRRPFTTTDAHERGFTSSAIAWNLKRGKWQRVVRGVYVEGAEPMTPMEDAVGRLLAVGGVASGSLAGILHGLDSVVLGRRCVTSVRENRHPGMRIMSLVSDEVFVVNGIPCTTGLRTAIDLASTLNDLIWEQALESALRKRLFTVSDLRIEIERLRPHRVAGVRRIKRVLECRPENAPPTESLLETLMVQLIRRSSLLPEPSRQVEVLNRYGNFVARVDLAWPELGIFIELDGRQHVDQPDYDARRETAVVAATGWLPGRFTWREVRSLPSTTLRRLEELCRCATDRRTGWNSTAPYVGGKREIG